MFFKKIEFYIENLKKITILFWTSTKYNFKTIDSIKILKTSFESWGLVDFRKKNLAEDIKKRESYGCSKKWKKKW
jgi:hypothetical protein